MEKVAKTVPELNTAQPKLVLLKIKKDILPADSLCIINIAYHYLSSISPPPYKAKNNKIRLKTVDN